MLDHQITKSDLCSVLPIRWAKHLWAVWLVTALHFWHVLNFSCSAVCKVCLMCYYTTASLASYIVVARNRDLYGHSKSIEQCWNSDRLKKYLYSIIRGCTKQPNLEMEPKYLTKTDAQLIPDISRTKSNKKIAMFYVYSRFLKKY